jgi:phosphoribosyl-ATP pyrophosphohydrolase/phosphoribosyl-AMP cyclohydrolase
MARSTIRTLDAAALRFDADGLVAAIVQDATDGRVLMVGWQDAEAVEATRRTGEVHFRSRSRETLWRKGETSGNTLAVESIEVDCDADAVLIRARPAGPTCHTGARSCFDEAPGAGEAAPGMAEEARGSAEASLAMGVAPRDVQGFAWLERLWSTIEARAVTRPEGSYTSRLLDGGVDAVARKVAEEAVEVVLAAKDDAAAEAVGADRPREALSAELADLLYHALVLCAERGLSPSDVITTLERRHRA